MSGQEITRLVDDLKTNAALRDKIKPLGHDTGAFVKLANSLGYQFDGNDLNAYVIEKQAQLSRDKAARLASGAAGAAQDDVVVVTSLVALALTSSSGVVTAHAVTTVDVVVIT
jgi:predicted ribosomally synthesized peptide with nif11-like leader